MNALRMVRAYLGAVLAGVIALNLILLLFLIARDLVTAIGHMSLEILKYTLIQNGITVAFSFAYSLPITALIAAPFTLLCIVLLGKTWGSSHKTAIMLGMCCPIVSTTLCALIMGMLSMGSNGPETNPFMMYLLTALALGAAAIPSGAVAGSVFWRLGLRPKASSIQPVLQNQ
ncbi:hypothetical protein [Agrobacterium vitis]|uniref:hypothetical protein n=1 Tax=Agrobacterium vitis TaxID=373 RepID=UPI003D2C8861